ncbi:plastocyanin/azurin family copper-binding protein [Paraburkholderia sp. A1RI-2L]|uniref:cupredoxin domain-containing protein n=1 Tax=Paraburkholderia sp. A1RI-2L TaxID=3028367 RepID=UPI003B77660C
MHATHRIAIIAIVVASGMTPHASWAQQTVNATLLSDSIQLETHSVKAGRLTLDIRNDASNTMAHELVVLKTNLPDDALPVGMGQVLEHKLKKIGEVEDIAPGKSKRASFTLAPGHYALICNKPGHYAMGMHTALVVTP